MLSRRLGAVLVVTLSCAVPCVAESATKEGEWRVTTKTELSGTPMEIPARTTTVTTCLTTEEPVPKPEMRQQECQILDVKVEGNNVSFRVECVGTDRVMSGSGKIVYQGDTFSGTQTGTISMLGTKSVTMVSHMTGKRLGPCKDEKPKVESNAKEEKKEENQEENKEANQEENPK